MQQITAYQKKTWEQVGPLLDAEFDRGQILVKQEQQKEDAQITAQKFADIFGY